VSNFDLVVDMFLAGGWRDITDDVRYDNGRGVTINYGYRDPTSPVSSQCTILLDNRAGSYSPSYVTGPWYGSIRQNVVMRVGSRVIRDFYVSRAASNGWGNATWALPVTSTLAWANSGGAAGDYSVTAGVAKHSLSSTATRVSSTANTYFDCEQRVSVQLPFTVPTGGPVYTSLWFRGTGTTPGFRAQMAIATSGVVTAVFYDSTGTVIGTPIVVSGLTYAGQKVRFAAYVHEGAFRAKVWDASTVEPYAWTIVGSAFTTPAVGTAGISTAKDATNSNGTFAVSYTDYELIFREFHGEVSQLEPERDTSGRDLRMAVTAAGPSRRLRANQWAKPLESPARRALRRAPGLVAYWPLEDGSNAGGWASVRSDWPDAFFTTGKPQQAAFSGFLASLPIPIVNAATAEQYMATYTQPTPNSVSMRFLVHVDTTSGEPTSQAPLCRFYSTGTAGFWVVRYEAGGGLRIQIQAQDFSTLYGSALGGAINDRLYRIGIDATQNGANIDWTVLAGEIGAPGAVFWTGTLAANTLGVARSVETGLDKNLTNVAIGHITVQNTVTSFFDFQNELNAWQGEQAHTRMQRISGEEGVKFHVEGNASVPMGPQPIAAFGDFLDQTVAADQGMVFESAYEDMLGYITSQFLSNRPVHLTLDYSLNQMFDKLPSASDDLLVVNKATVTGSNASAAGTASSVTMSQTTGPNAAVPIESGGVGVYERSYTINTATINNTRDLAGYLVAVGTIDQPRLPQVTMWLHNQRIYTAAATLLTAMQIDAGKVMSLANLPRTVASDTVRETVIGYSKRLTQFEYAVTWNTVFGEKYQIATTDDTGIRVEAGSAYLNTTINSAVTSISVKSLDSTVFSTSGADVPFDIRLGGERMTVTAISGATSPQTFTVTRSVNGVVKGHTADDTELAKIYLVSYAVVALA
jgi:hypothetical protein